jgi:LEA14-like dessication related protein
MRVLSILLAGWALAACVGFPYGDIDPPQVYLSNIRLTDAGLFEQRYRLDVRIQNPNDVELPIGGMSYRLSLNGRQFATGVSSGNWTLPAYGDRIVSIDLVSSTAKVLEQYRRLQKGTEAVDYALAGNIRLGRHGPEVPFESVGRLQLAD